MPDVKRKEFNFIPAHSRAARGLLDITQEQLAAAAGVDAETIRRFERGDQRPYQSTLAKIREALERRGIEFTNGDSPGVRLRPEHSILQ